jgi:phytanoyl-CoA hydroxylase
LRCAAISTLIKADFGKKNTINVKDKNREILDCDSMSRNASITGTSAKESKGPVAQTAVPSAAMIQFPHLDMSRLSSQFNSEGYVVLKGMLDQEVLRNVQAEMEKLVDVHAKRLFASGTIKSLFLEEPFETRWCRLYEGCLEQAPKVFREELHGAGLYSLFFDAGLLDAVEAVLGGEIRLYPNYSARPKLPEWEGTQVLWHQDGGYTEQVKSDDGQVETLRMANVWTPLVPARVENGCMQFIPGTHKLGGVQHLKKEHYLEIAPEYLEPRLEQTVNIELDPGDVVLFHNLLFHQGLPNHSKSIRWSLDWRYQDATQPTMRKESGHIARSRNHPETAVQSPQHWASLSFC